MNAQKSSQILTMIAKAGQPFTFPGMWRTIPCAKAFFQLPPDHSELLSKLRTKFSDEMLLEAGVVETSPAGEIELHQSLTQPDSPIWAIKVPDEGRMAALVAHTHYIGFRNAAVAAAIKFADSISRSKASDANIIVAYDMVSLALWRSLGFTAVAGEDWSKLQPEQFRGLMQALGVSQGVEALENQLESPPHLLVEGPYGNISPVRLPILLANGSLVETMKENISSAEASWTFLKEIHRHFPKAVRDFQLWRPSESLLEPVQLLQRIGKPDCIASHLLKSLERDSISIDPKCADRPSCVDELERALRTWHSSVEVASTPEGPRKAFAHLMATYERLQFRPLIDAAANTDDAIERNLLLSLVELKRLLVPLVLHTSHSMLRQIRDSGSRSVDAFTPDPFKQLSMLMDREVKLIKEIQSGRQRQPPRNAPTPTEPIARTILPLWAHPRRSCAS